MTDRTEYQAEYRRANKEKIAAYRKKWNEANPEKVKAYRDKHYANQDPVARAAYMAQYQKDNREKVNAINRAFYLRNLDVINAYKKEKGCEECGYRNPVALVFHHRNPAEKSFTIGKKMNRMRHDKLLVEAAKCAVLCSNCHLVYHSKHPEIFTTNKNGDAARAYKVRSAAWNED